MKGTDRFLLGIVIGVILLVGVAFAVAFLRPTPTYRSEETPENVAHNYLLALQQQDYERAYGYLSPRLEGYPASAEIFARDAERFSWNFRLDSASASLEVESARVAGEQATVMVRELRFDQGGLFNSNQYANRFEMRLRNEAGGWRITGSDAYWAFCWDDPDGCR